MLGDMWILTSHLLVIFQHGLLMFWNIPAWFMKKADS